ncbi:MAG: nuclear transport factor 2 family protein [Dehalococcoidia bacterium]|jgi:ketosteroid isomerase-like protein|nr:nuclear transport factor 2 family protein [Dehalococcoidia bacterium]
METTDSLIEANTRFYRAFELFDIEEMNELWDKELAVTCIHPGWPLIQGRSEILQSWINIFNNTMVMQFTITESSIKIEGEWGWIVCTESLRSVVNGKVNEGRVEATNIFRRVKNQWYLVHHHGSPIIN